MPIVVRKLPNQNCYRVFNDKTKTIHSKCSSLGNAKSQQRLLNAVDRGWRPTGGMLNAMMDARAKWKEGWNEYKVDMAALKDGISNNMLDSSDMRSIQNRLNEDLDKVAKNLKLVTNPTAIEIKLIERAKGGRDELYSGLLSLVG
jgi:hypothetical protein